MINPETQKQTALITIHANIFDPYIMITCMYTINSFQNTSCQYPTTNPATCKFTQHPKTCSFQPLSDSFNLSIDSYTTYYFRMVLRNTADQWPAILLFIFSFVYVHTLGSVLLICHFNHFSYASIVLKIM